MKKIQEEIPYAELSDVIRCLRVKNAIRIVGEKSTFQITPTGTKGRFLGIWLDKLR